MHYEYYWSEKFKDPEVVGTEVEIRYDPFDISHVFAFVKGEWTPCTAAQQYPLTIKYIAEFLASVEAEEEFGLQRLCDAEFRDILQIIDVGYAGQFHFSQVPSLLLSSPDEGEDDDEENAVDEPEIYGDYE